jgi:hypothetical protein
MDPGCPHQSPLHSRKSIVLCRHFDNHAPNARPTSLVTEHDDALHVAVCIRDLQLDTGESLVLCQGIIVSELNPWSGTSIRGLTFTPE